MRIDVHGHGGSSELDRSMLLDEMAEDYFDLVQQLGSNGEGYFLLFISQIA